MNKGNTRKVIPINNIDYVEYFANRLKEDNTLFEQHKKFINAQLDGSRSLFNNMFAGNFKENARKYLRKIGILNK